MPSLYEAGGTVDMIASLFGNVPVVRSVGGLVKVLDGRTGFSFRGGADEFPPEAEARPLPLPDRQRPHPPDSDGRRATCSGTFPLE